MFFFENKNSFGLRFSGFFVSRQKRAFSNLQKESII